ncbi:MAG: competence/damage-inducible protein A [Bacteroidetes bacterium]|nr:competence/damage-inducible protein A [Bacteroidota bacterium]
MKAEILTIGDEILIGQIVDTNSSWIASRLIKENIKISRMISLSDNKEQMLEIIHQSLERSDVVIITGGLGPTKDDLTKNVLATYFNSSWRWDDNVLKMLEERFNNRGKHLFELNKQQAYLPDNCITIFNDRGTAPGMFFQKNKKLLFSLPGVPYEMQGMIEDSIIPSIKEHFEISPVIFHHFLTINVAESVLAKRLSSIEDNLPEHLKLAYLPHINTVRLRLTCNVIHPKEDRTMFDDIVKLIKSALGNDLITEEDISFEEYIFKILKEKGKTISFAESCTGGLISARFTQIPGVSAVYQGAVISYSNEVKNKVLGVPDDLLKNYGAVSPEVAKAMAEGCRKHLNSDYALSVTGIAGPDGGTDEKPVGTVYIGISSSNGTQTNKLFYPAQRHRIMEYSMLSVLNLLRLVLNKE